MTLTSECSAWWNALFPDVPPAGFLLRQAYHQRWLRIHSLPASKRYPESETEYTELLSRHNTVATDLLGQNSPCYLIQGYWLEPSISEGDWVANLQAANEKLWFQVSTLVWKAGQHDRLLLDVANWKRTNIVIASRETNCVYAPYDGGADLILRNEQERNERKQVYRKWLSMAPGGL